MMIIINDKKYFSTTRTIFMEDENHSDTDTDYSSNEEDSQSKIVHRKTYFKNDFRKEGLKYEFNKNKIFTNTDNLTKEEKIYKERVDISDEKRELKYDLLSVIKGKMAILKISQNKIPKKNE